MGGRVGFTSSFGVGSKFWVEFPIVEGSLQTKAHQGAGGATATAGAGSRTILCVEDNLSSLKFLEALIEGIPDTAMVSAPTGEIGIEMAELHQPDLILMDLNLPGIDGEATRRALSETPGTARIPVIALTAAASKDDMERGLAAGFSHYLTKPIDVSEVTAAINETLGPA